MNGCTAARVRSLITFRSQCAQTPKQNSVPQMMSQRYGWIGAICSATTRTVRVLKFVVSVTTGVPMTSLIAGVYAFGLFALLFGKRSGFHRLFQREQHSGAGSGRFRSSSRHRRGRRDTNSVSRSPSRSPSPSRTDMRALRHANSQSQYQQRGMLIGVANALLHVPMVCTFLSWFGFIPVAPACLAEACSSDHNVALVPGGISEMTAFEGPHVEVISLLDRKGFIRLALQHGRDLVPVYGFGENRAFKQYVFNYVLTVHACSERWMLSDCLHNTSLVARYTCFRQTRRHLARRLRLALHLFR